MSRLSRSFLRSVIPELLIPCLLVPVGISYQAVLLISSPPTYTSGAELSLPATSAIRNQGGVQEVRNRDFQMKKYSMECMQVINPHADQMNVRFHAEANTSNNGIQLSATGRDPASVVQGLDAWMEKISALPSGETNALSVSELGGARVIPGRASTPVRDLTNWGRSLLWGGVLAFLVGLLPMLFSSAARAVTGFRAAL